MKSDEVAQEYVNDYIIAIRRINYSRQNLKWKAGLKLTLHTYQPALYSTHCVA